MAGSLKILKNGKQVVLLENDSRSGKLKNFREQEPS